MLEQLDNGIDGGGLSGAGASSQDKQVMADCLLDGILLQIGILDAVVLLQGIDAVAGIPDGVCANHQHDADSGGKVVLGFPIFRKVAIGATVDRGADDLLAANQHLQRLFDHNLVLTEQPGAGRQELVLRQTGVSVGKVVAQNKLKGGFDAVGAVRRNLELGGNHLALLKPHAHLLAAEETGVFLNHALCHRSPTLPDGDGGGGVDSELGEEQHDAAHPEHSAKLGFQLFALGRGDALNLGKALGLCFQNL